MKKVGVCLLLALLLSVAGQRQVRQAIWQAARGLAAKQTDTSVGQTVSPGFTEQLGGREVSDQLGVTLYFRFLQTELLGAQRVQMDLRREETVATRIVQSLVEGPDISHPQLSGVFPQGTQVLSVEGEGTTAFVTLSTSFLGQPDGAPADWEDLTFWQEEAALRRTLAIQSIVLALTEGGRYQRVQLFVADSDNDIPQRIPMALLDTQIHDASVVLAPCGRDEHVLLTPQRMMTRILEAWKQQDWEDMYALLAPGQESLPTLSVFETMMREREAALLRYEVSSGVVSLDGQQATLVLDAQIRCGGDIVNIVREAVPVVRWADNWSLTMESLNSLMIRD